MSRFPAGRGLGRNRVLFHDVIPEPAGRSDAIAFVGTVPKRARDRVEAFFYFNPRQGGLLPQIRQTVEETGSPFIEEENQRIWIGVPGGTTQCLFACVPVDRPVGVALYCRPTSELIRIVHLAVETSTGGKRRDDGRVAGALVEKIRSIAARINGVRRVQLPYRADCFLRVLASR